MEKITDIQCLYLTMIKRWGKGSPVSYHFIENFSRSIKIDSTVWEEILEQLINEAFLVESNDSYSLTERANDLLISIDPNTLFMDNPEFRELSSVSTFLKYPL